MIYGYDDWKTTPPADPETVGECEHCMQELYNGDEVLINEEGEKFCSYSCAFSHYTLENITLDI